MPTFATAEQLAKEGRGRAVVSTGAVVTLDKSVIVGRTPRASRVTGEMPHLVTVPSPTQDISRSHVELRVEGSAVVAIDLNTTNGTLVRRDGAEPVRLHPGEPHVLLNGDVIDIGDGVTITLEDLP
jgi:pSer/pThr/pTyr-binding forkhead associated (FHA) protein